MLIIEGVVSGYGKSTVLRGISLEVARGSVVTLLGANGAGKTTTLRTISGMVCPLAGGIVFEGSSIGGLPAYEIARMGIVHCPEGREIFPGMTVAENLRVATWALKTHGRRVVKEGTERVLTLFPRLKDFMNRLANTLSGGEQQMLAIGRSLMARPRLLLLDEPSLGLSPLLVEAIFEAILELHKADTTILLVEQNASLALEIADYGYVLSRGQVVLSGTAESLLSNEQVRCSYLG